MRSWSGPLGVKALVVLASVLALGGCAGESPERGTTLVFKHARILGPTDPIPALLREFEDRHPGVRVKSESLPWTSDEQHQFYAINLEGGSPGFDVMMLDVIWVTEFARAGWLFDLSPLLAADETAPYFPSAVAAAAYDGRVWALPWNMNVGMLYYRADLLAKHGLSPPDTWEELVDQVRRIRAAERDPALEGYLWQGKQYEGMVVNVLESFWANGTRLLAEDGRLFPEPDRAAEALAFLRRLIETGVSPGWVTAADEELSRRTFGDGHAIFLRNWPYALDLFEAPSSRVRGKVGIAPLPRRAGSATAGGSTGGSHLGISRRSAHPAAALALVRFLTSARAQRAMVSGAALYPSRQAVYHDPNLIQSHPMLPRIHALMVAGRPRPVTPYYLVLSTTLQPEFSAVLVGLKPPHRAIRDGRRRLEHFLISVR
ncbi:MAG TPA: ABC transporter substrate-binding protein [Methylomirabilota bacterium]|nr:ABC transporter substrate-binding protein [Methylomirabilota bacterium]